MSGRIRNEISRTRRKGIEANSQQLTLEGAGRQDRRLRHCFLRGGPDHSRFLPDPHLRAVRGKLPFPGGPSNSNDANVRIFFTLGVLGPILALAFGLIGRARIGGSEGKLRGRVPYRAGIVFGVGMGSLCCRRIHGPGLPVGTRNPLTLILLTRTVLLERPRP